MQQNQPGNRCFSATHQAGRVFVTVRDDTRATIFRLSIDAARILANCIGYAANDAERAQRPAAKRATLAGRDCMSCKHAEELETHPSCAACLRGPGGFSAWEAPKVAGLAEWRQGRATGCHDCKHLEARADEGPCNACLDSGGAFMGWEPAQ